jgi:hypothetical protein
VKHADFKEAMVYKRKEEHRKDIYTMQKVVLTTWDELRMSCPFPDKFLLKELLGGNKKTKKGADDDTEETGGLEAWIEEHRSEGGHIHNIYFHRVCHHCTHAYMELADFSLPIKIILDESVSFSCL